MRYSTEKNKCIYNIYPCKEKLTLINYVGKKIQVDFPDFAFMGTGNTQANVTSSDLLTRPPFFHTHYVFHTN